VALVGGSIALFEVREADVRAAWRSGGRVESGMALGLLLRDRDPAGAAEAFAQVLARRPGHYGALFQRAAALEAAGRPAEAALAWRAFLAAAEAARDAEHVARARARIAEIEAAERPAARPPRRSR
jgi:predicted TPR repeat methyltransferase